MGINDLQYFLIIDVSIVYIEQWKILNVFIAFDNNTNIDNISSRK